MRRYSWIMAVLLLVLIAGGASAQEPVSPIIALLASVPDTPAAGDMFGYADYQALAANETGTYEDRYTQALINSVTIGPDRNYFVVQMDEQERLIGVSPFDVAQGARWGAPPGETILFQGAFDAAAIEAAFTARDYTVETQDGLTLFCGPAGCDEGTAINPGKLEPGDPFGGRLGRQQPVLLAGQGDQMQLISSPPLDVLSEAAAAASGTAPSLAQNPAYLTALNAVMGENLLLQAYFLAPERIGNAPDTAERLPAYELVLLSQMDEDGSRAAAATLVYATLADAEAAAEILERRIDDYVSSRTGEPLVGMLKDRGAVVTFSAANDEATGLASAQVTFRGPDDARLYHLLVQMVSGRDLGWLAA